MQQLAAPWGISTRLTQVGLLRRLTTGCTGAQVVRNVQNILQTNCSVASSLGPPFLSQMSLVYVDMLSVYK